MRYIPMSQYTFDEICQQCSAAINRPAQQQQPVAAVDYDEVRKFFHYDKELVAQ